MAAPRKRDSELQRPRERKGATQSAPNMIGERRGVKIPSRRNSWSANARKWYESLGTSGQADFFQDSDWAFALFIADEMTDYSKQARKSPEKLKALIDAMARLGTTEVDRLKSRIELQAPAEVEESVGEAAVADYKAQLTVVPGVAS